LTRHTQATSVRGDAKRVGSEAVGASVDNIDGEEGSEGMGSLLKKLAAFILAAGIMWAGLAPAAVAKGVNCKKYPYCCQCVPYGTPCKTC
jgi:hypothetical protein